MDPIRPLALLPLALAAAASATPQITTTRASVSGAGVQGDNSSLGPALSADGRYVAFFSDATNLVAGDTNTARDVFLRDRLAGTTTRVSINPAIGQSNSNSQYPALSADARYVAFDSFATNLVAGDGNFRGDAFVLDRQTGLMFLESRATGGAQANDHAFFVDISDDGRWIVWHSAATNLVIGDTNAKLDVFYRDRNQGVTFRASLSSGGIEGDGDSSFASISPDGRWIAFDSAATNLVAGDNNGVRDVFLRDRVTNTTTRVSVGTGGLEANGASAKPSVALNGAAIAFESLASNLVAGGWIFSDVFVHTVATNTTVQANVRSNGALGFGAAFSPSLSNDARFVAFEDYDPSLVDGDTNGVPDVFLHDFVTGATVRVSLATDGTQSDGNSTAAPALTPDGRFVATESTATTFVAGDTNAVRDVFVHDRAAAVAVVYCTAETNSLGCVPTMAYSGFPSATAATSFDVQASNVLNNKSGLLFYGFRVGNSPFQGGTLCVAPPTTRTPVQDSSGNAPPDDCSGAFSYDFNARIQSGVDPRLVVGTVVYSQYWSRDPADASSTNLTDALSFSIQP